MHVEEGEGDVEKLCWLQCTGSYTTQNNHIGPKIHKLVFVLKLLLLLLDLQGPKRAYIMQAILVIIIIRLARP